MQGYTSLLWAGGCSRTWLEGVACVSHTFLYTSATGRSRLMILLQTRSSIPLSSSRRATSSQAEEGRERRGGGGGEDQPDLQEGRTVPPSAPPTCADLILDVPHEWSQARVRTPVWISLHLTLQELLLLWVLVQLEEEDCLFGLLREDHVA